MTGAPDECAVLMVTEVAPPNPGHDCHDGPPAYRARSELGQIVQCECGRYWTLVKARWWNDESETHWRHITAKTATRLIKERGEHAKPA